MQKLENRIPPVMITLTIGLIMWFISIVTPRLPVDKTIKTLIATNLFSLGAFFSLAGVLAFKRAETTVNPSKPEHTSELVNTGIYKITRNPMYVGFALILGAWSAWLASPWSLSGVVGFILYMNRFQIGPEEKALEALFGDSFDDYKNRVRRWL